MLWKKTKERVVYNGRRKVLKKNFRLPDGRYETYDILFDEPSVCVLPLTQELEVILVEQFRPAFEKTTLELPAGYLDGTETPREAARRELIEETGYDFEGSLTPVVDTLPHAYADIVMHNFIATFCVEKSAPKFLPDEHIRVVKMSLADFKHHLRSAPMVNSACAWAGLDYLRFL